MVRIALTEADSFAAIRARSRLGIAIAAMIRIIATTISNSISEKPFCFRISFFPLAVCGLLDLNYREYSHFIGQCLQLAYSFGRSRLVSMPGPCFCALPGCRMRAIWTRHIAEIVPQTDNLCQFATDHETTTTGL